MTETPQTGIKTHIKDTLKTVFAPQRLLKERMERGAQRDLASLASLSQQIYDKRDAFTLEERDEFTHQPGWRATPSQLEQSTFGHVVVAENGPEDVEVIGLTKKNPDRGYFTMNCTVADSKQGKGRHFAFREARLSDEAQSPLVKQLGATETRIREDGIQYDFKSQHPLVRFTSSQQLPLTFEFPRRKNEGLRGPISQFEIAIQIPQHRGSNEPPRMPYPARFVFHGNGAQISIGTQTYPTLESIGCAMQNVTRHPDGSITFDFRYKDQPVENIRLPYIPPEPTIAQLETILEEINGLSGKKE